MLAEEVGEFEQLLGVARQAGELGEYEAGDAAGADVGEHPLGFRMVNHRLARHNGQVVELFDCPAVESGVLAGAFLVMLRALALGLILGRDPNLDANRLVTRRTVFHTTAR